jgi:hypothetical protein
VKEGFFADDVTLVTVKTSELDWTLHGAMQRWMNK